MHVYFLLYDGEISSNNFTLDTSLLVNGVQVLIKTDHVDLDGGGLITWQLDGRVGDG